jgi:hypothetical protein
MIVFRLARLLPTPESVGERRVVIALPLLEAHLGKEAQVVGFFCRRGTAVGKKRGLTVTSIQGEDGETCC